ncbi:sugar-phosphatase [Acerihabitans sp. KWT182]|uniref:Sugar-phosphatase n=1 Tax=Acerihabitans sp. KWT182 TaxID=3157919 RepID=A0AAU7QC10_9GAMM
MAIKLIAIDMDGTLLNQKHEISPAVKHAISAARDKGVEVVLATGRPFIGIQRYLMELDLQGEGRYCITNNGALVQRTDNGDRVSEITLDFDDYLYFEALARQLDVHFHALSFSTLYTANRDISRYTVYESFLTGMPLQFRRVDEMNRELRFPKVMMIDDPAVLDQAITRIPHEAFERYTIMKSAEYYLELLRKEANKGEGVKALARHLHLAADEIMTIGDQANDLAMIKYAGIGVAMGNGIDEIKAASQFVTKSNLEDGVAVAIEKFVLNSR